MFVQKTRDMIMFLSKWIIGRSKERMERSSFPNVNEVITSLISTLNASYMQFRLDKVQTIKSDVA